MRSMSIHCSAFFNQECAVLKGGSTVNAFFKPDTSRLRRLPMTAGKGQMTNDQGLFF
jgi:hypothetical protein